MSTTEFDLESKRLSVKEPDVRYDKQGDMESEERINKAMHHFVKNFNTQTASYLDGCLHCGMCADACHFHVRTCSSRRFVYKCKGWLSYRILGWSGDHIQERSSPRLW